MARHFLPSGDNNASRRSLAPRAAKVHYAIRPAWDSGTEWWGRSMYALLATRQISVSMSLSLCLCLLLSPHPPPFLALSGRPFGKETVTVDPLGTWSVS